MLKVGLIRKYRSTPGLLLPMDDIYDAAIVLDDSYSKKGCGSVISGWLVLWIISFADRRN